MTAFENCKKKKKEKSSFHHSSNDLNQIVKTREIKRNLDGSKALFSLLYRWFLCFLHSMTFFVGILGGK